MSYHFQPMTLENAHAIAEWCYPGEYAFYNMDADLDDLREFLNNSAWEQDTNFAVTDDCDALVGFFEFIRQDDAIAIGLGLRPDMTGRGLGEAFLRAGIAFAVEHFKPPRLKMAVATFNQRRIAVYLRAGFSTTQTSMQATNGGVFEFIEMECGLDG